MTIPKNYTFILFDLDGTLTDPYEGISKSVQFALSKFNIIEEDEARLRKMIGPPLMHSLKKYYDFSDEQYKEAIIHYREYFVKKGIFENKIYEGIRSLLVDLTNAGKIVRLASSKPEVFAKQILEMFSIDSFFNHISGSSLDGKIIEKPQVVKKAIGDISPGDFEHTVMVGDREYDIQGAIANSIDSIGVLYGFGSYDELKNAGATYIVKSVQELRELLL
jgi:phosphoglycolate phosphatase